MYKKLKFIFRLTPIVRHRLELLSKNWQMSKADVIAKLIMDKTEDMR